MSSEQQSGRLIIRKAAPSDTEGIRRLLERVKLPTESVGKNTTTFYVGEYDGALAAVAGFEFYGQDVLLRSVAVRPEFQRRGLGDEIADFMISTARARRVQRIVLLTETAQQFFEKKGFKVVDRSSIVHESMKQSSEFISACPASAVCMVLTIAQRSD